MIPLFSFPRWGLSTAATVPCWSRPESWPGRTAWWWPAFSSTPSSSTILPTCRPTPALRRRTWSCAKPPEWITCFPRLRKRCMPESAASAWRKIFCPLHCAGRHGRDIFPGFARFWPNFSIWCSLRTPSSGRRITSNWRLSAAWCATWIFRCASTVRRSCGMRTALPILPGMPGCLRSRRNRLS